MPGQLRHTGEIEDLSAVVLEWTHVLEPIVEIKAVPVVGSDIARIGVRAKHLKAMRETLVGAQQQTLVCRAALPFLSVDRPFGADRLWIGFLSCRTDGNDRITNAIQETVVVVEVDIAKRQMFEVPVCEIDAQHEVSGNLALRTHTGVQCRRGLIVRGKYPRLALLRELDRLNRRVGIGQGLDQAGPQRWQNCQKVSARK